jgi:hypothetical protein
MIYSNATRILQGFHRDHSYPSRFFNDNPSSTSLFRWRFGLRLAPLIMPGRKDDSEDFSFLKKLSVGRKLSAARLSFSRHKANPDILRFKGDNSLENKHGLAFRIFSKNRGLSSPTPYFCHPSKFFVASNLSSSISKPFEEMEVGAPSDHLPSDAEFNERDEQKHIDTQILHSKISSVYHSLNLMEYIRKNYDRYKKEENDKDELSQNFPSFIKGNVFSFDEKGRDTNLPPNSFDIANNHIEPMLSQNLFSHTDLSFLSANLPENEKFKIPECSTYKKLCGDECIAQGSHQEENEHSSGFIVRSQYQPTPISFRPNSSRNTNAPSYSGFEHPIISNPFNSLIALGSEKFDDSEDVSMNFQERPDEWVRPATRNFIITGEIWLDSISLKYWITECLSLALMQGGQNTT